MNKRLILASMLFLVLMLSACGTNPDVTAVEQVVLQSEQASVKAVNGQGSLADVEEYFATTLEGGNIDPNLARHIAYSAVLTGHTNGFVQLSNFQFNSVTVDSAAGEARVLYQIDITILRPDSKNTATVTQSLMLVKTPARGWRIQGGDGPDAGEGDNSFLGNLLSQ